MTPPFSYCFEPQSDSFTIVANAHNPCNETQLVCKKSVFSAIFMIILVKCLGDALIK